tara:strand:+ start:590 stop:760 length:171 start_codon:yes stop_codon:yes gene_type:complete
MADQGGPGCVEVVLPGYLGLIRLFEFVTMITNAHRIENPRVGGSIRHLGNNNIRYL